MKSAAVAGFDNPQRLSEAFSEFVSASEQLESSYRDLKCEVARLNGELADRNTELAQSLEQNNGMRAMLEQTIDSMPCGVLVLDAEDRIVRINPEGRRLLGSATRRARTLSDLAGSTQIDFRGLMEANDGQDVQMRLNTMSSSRWLAIGRRELASAPAGEMASSLRSIWVLRDVTANKQAEQEREEARRAMALAEISTILAHEIRNPLASLELFAGLITEAGAENSFWIANLRAGIRSLSGTVNNVLSLNSPSDHRMIPLDLMACVRSAVEFTRPIAEQAGVTLTCVPHGDVPRIRGNEEAIRQILLNLISNAVRHTAEGGRIDVTLHGSESDGARLTVVEVSDTGCGIAEEALERIFEAGFSGTGGSPGLGLAVCQRLIEQHSGRIRVTSAIARGSHFQLEFPAI